jgi:outer membrane protein assembly factor BamE (lipoprotein component of BamABCDE complex)
MANLGKKGKSLLFLMLLVVFMCNPGCRNRAQSSPGQDESRATKPRAGKQSKPPREISASRLTKAKLDQVKCGMNENEIQEVLGPATTAMDNPGGRRQLTWKEGRKMVEVVLERDKAMVFFASHMDQEPAKITRANADRVKPGMTESQVVEILGPGQGESWAGTSKTIIWEKGLQQIEATFAEGRLVAKEVRGF